MTVRLLFLLLIFSSYFSSPVWGCTCISLDTFCETITDDNGAIYPNVSIVRGFVKEKTAQGIIFRVTVELGGTPITERAIFIGEGQGADCRMSVQHFDRGEELIIAVRESNSRYWLSICGVTFLEIRNETVRGRIAPGISTLPYARFLSLAHCGNLKNRIPNFQVRPTVFQHQFSIFLDEDIEAPVLASLAVYNNLGQLVQDRKARRFAARESYTYQLSSLACGLYFLKIKTEKGSAVFRLIKIR